MKITPVMNSLSGITGGTLSAGRVPLARLTDYDVLENAGPVTVTTAGQTIVASTAVSAAEGDVFLVDVMIKGTRNATAGTLTASMVATGAVVRPVGWQQGFSETGLAPTINTQYTYRYSFLATCYAAGNVVFGCQGQMVGAGSTFVCANLDSIVRVRRIPVL